jgi:outer membrane protein
MKPLSPLTALLTTYLVFFSAAAASQESNLRGDSPHYIEDGWDVRLGVAVLAVSADFYRGMKDLETGDFLVDVNYRNGNFFFTTTDDASLTLGYSLLRDEDWVVDVVFGPRFYMDFGEDDLFDGQLSHLEDRDIDGHLGARFSWYGDSNRVSASLTRDVIDAHDGYLASIDYQHEWQLRNWVVTGRAGVARFSDDMVNHIVGVSAAEATVATPQYQAEAGNATLFELTVEYPLNEDWIFEGNAASAIFDSGFKDSPIVEGDSLTVISAGFKYQF